MLWVVGDRLVVLLLLMGMLLLRLRLLVPVMPDMLLLCCLLMGWCRRLRVGVKEVVLRSVRRQ